MSKPKLVNGAELSGPQLADLIERMVAALNSRDIPTAGSILEHFNKDLIQKVRRRRIEAEFEPLLMGCHAHTSPRLYLGEFEAVLRLNMLQKGRLGWDAFRS